MFAGCWQRMWARWQRIWARDPGYCQLIWAANGDVCGHGSGCLRAATPTQMDVGAQDRPSAAGAGLAAGEDPRRREICGPQAMPCTDAVPRRTAPLPGRDKRPLVGGDTPARCPPPARKIGQEPGLLMIGGGPAQPRGHSRRQRSRRSRRDGLACAGAVRVLRTVGERSTGATAPDPGGRAPRYAPRRPARSRRHATRRPCPWRRPRRGDRAARTGAGCGGEWWTARRRPSAHPWAWLRRRRSVSRPVPPRRRRPGMPVDQSGRARPNQCEKFSRRRVSDGNGRLRKIPCGAKDQARARAIREIFGLESGPLRRAQQTVPRPLCGGNGSRKVARAALYVTVASG